MNKMNRMYHVALAGWIILLSMSITPLSHALASPVESAPPTEIQAVIIESGSTATCPYTIVVWLNGTAAYTSCNRIGTGTIPPTLTIQFFEHVILALPFSNLPHIHCLKPTSFRTTTIIQYAHLFTLDISCPSLDKHIADLFSDTTQIQQVLSFSILRKT